MIAGADSPTRAVSAARGTKNHTLAPPGAKEVEGADGSGIEGEFWEPLPGPAGAVAEAGTSPVGAEAAGFTGVPRELPAEGRAGELLPAGVALGLLTGDPVPSGFAGLSGPGAGLPPDGTVLGGPAGLPGPDPGVDGTGSVGSWGRGLVMVPSGGTILPIAGSVGRAFWTGASSRGTVFCNGASSWGTVLWTG
jgi:hypothetical protein